MRIFLSGPMGAGKSTVGRALALQMGRPYLDLDDEISRRAGASVRDVFSKLGEPAFRRLEREEITRLLAEAPDDAVVALGGGAVVDGQSRRMLLSHGTVVTLMAPVAVLTSRVAADSGRPLLAGGDAADVLSALLRERRGAYAECHAVVSTAGKTVDDSVDEIVRAVGARPIVVALGERSYRVEIGRGVRRGAASRIAATTAGPIVLVTDENVVGPWGADIAEDLRRTHDVTVVTLPPGEPSKHVGSVEKIWDAALSTGAQRDSLVLAVGGGVVGDLAGFAAATLLRGVRFGQVPTTLLAMVDASVGGKTGFDRAQGKNLVGAFHQPSFVLCDVETLTTLPREERISGLAEVVKSAWLAGEDEVAALEADAAALRDGEPEATERAIRMAVALKASIVTRDEREGGLRRVLNLGHTVGHAFEAEAGFGELRHGDAVSLGMVAAFRVARALGVGGPADENRATALLAALGLPVDIAGRGSERVQSLVGADKKRVGAGVRFIAPGAPGEVVDRPIDLEELRPLIGMF